MSPHVSATSNVSVSSQTHKVSSLVILKQARRDKRNEILLSGQTQWLNSVGTGRNGVPPPVSGVPPPEIAVPPPTVVVPPPGRPNDVPSPIGGTIIKIVATRGQILRLKCTKYYFGWGSAPDPAGERLQRSPRTPSWKGAGLFLRGMGGREGKGGERLRKGREGKGGKKCSVPLPTFE